MSRYASDHDYHEALTPPPEEARLTCECCGNAAPGEVTVQPDDGESGTYAAVCTDFNACMVRRRADMEAYLDALEPEKPVYGHDDRTPAEGDEMPF